MAFVDQAMRCAGDNLQTLGLGLKDNISKMPEEGE